MKLKHKEYIHSYCVKLLFVRNNNVQLLYIVSLFYQPTITTNFKNFGNFTVFKKL